MKQGGCVLEAFKLKMQSGMKGSVYCVMEAGGKHVGHAYYVPEGLSGDDIALNQADNGYPQYPALSVRDVVENGTLYF